ncbi:hypothetical protein NO2_1411 [Candidatus Termititenax persephonae]|uniref:Uncharacterized protein n=1 Tax=Candidatus Termititenax persephonae TaxID=2218525 RepID=A0A388TJC2_9BACT|nr:hypothetical protein NO2_1411 [Candidatus Termititenax persephonae]
MRAYYGMTKTRRNNYHICLTTHQPIYGLIFKELSALLIHSFNSLGRPSVFKVNEFAPDKTNIILGDTIYADYADKLKNLKYIPWQMEQLDTAEGHYSSFPHYQNFLQNAAAVWDYSMQNIKFLRGLGLSAQHLPIGWHAKLETIPASPEKDLDVLFYGTLNERRLKIIEQLEGRGVKVGYTNFTLGAERDRLIARAKIVLNIHYWHMAILETARIHYLLNNKVFVITEQSVDNPYPQVDLVSVPYDQLAEECVRRLADWENSQKLAELNYEQFKKYYPMPELLKKVL